MTTKNLSRWSMMMLAATLAVASGCSKQDPFADKPESIRNGVPPEEDREPPAAKPVAADALRIDTLDFYTFKEGVESEFTVNGRVLIPNTDFDLSIDNMRDFPNANFDAATGVFKWNPPRETTGQDYGAPKRLVVRLTTKSAPIIGTTKSVLLYVTRGENDPQIVEVDDLKRIATREREIRPFKVVVRDADAMDLEGLRPRLLAVTNKRGVSDIAGLIYMKEPTTSEPNPVQDTTDKSKWTFNMIMDLRGREFTAHRETFNFALQAISRFGRTGTRNIDADIQTDVERPQVSWVDQIDAFANQENRIQFTVYDPKGEGKLSVNWVTRLDTLPGAATGSCTDQSRDGAQLCTISWKPTESAAGGPPIDIEFEVLNQSKVPGDIKFIKEKFRRKVQIKKLAVTLPPMPGASPSPTPAPSTPPAPTPATPR